MPEPKHHYGYDRFKWKNNKLTHEGKFLVELVPHEKYEKHYYLKFCWRKEKTPEFFNLVNAKMNAMEIALVRLNYDVWETHLPASLMRLNLRDRE